MNGISFFLFIDLGAVGYDKAGRTCGDSSDKVGTMSEQRDKETRGRGNGSILYNPELIKQCRFAAVADSVG